VAQEPLLKARQWDQTQCSFCGDQGRQFVCWDCFQTTVEDLKGEFKGEINLLKKRFEERIANLERDLHRRKRDERGY